MTHFAARSQVFNAEKSAAFLTPVIAFVEEHLGESASRCMNWRWKPASARSIL